MAQGIPVIIGLGEILWDMLPGGKVLGGAPANFAYHCSQLGAESYVVSAVGKDGSGCEILELLEQLQLPGEHVHIEERYPTGTVTVRLDGAGHPTYTIHKNVAWDYIPFEEGSMEVFTAADAVCFGSLAQRSPLSRKSVISYLDATPPGCLRVFDINLRQDYYSKEVLERSLQLADVLKLNDDELEVLAAMFSLKGKEDALLESLLQTYDLKIVALTKGSEGSLLHTGAERSEYRSEAVQSVDTVGAGDSFAAAMVMGYLLGHRLKDLHRLASDVASFVCTQEGATPGLPESIIREINPNKA
jgi:fructokinase